MTLQLLKPLRQTPKKLPLNQPLPPKLNNWQIGLIAQRQVVAFLTSKNYRILAQNYRWHHLEIDLIAWDSNCQQLVFIEVKQRAKTKICQPVNAVDQAKLNRLTLAAEHYRQQHHLNSLYRFDIVTVTGLVTPLQSSAAESNSRIKIDHFPNVSYDLM